MTLRALAALAAALSLSLTGCTDPTPPPQPRGLVHQATVPPEPAPRPDTYRVDRVVDGDTVRIIRDGKSVALRLIGGDTPETVHPSKPVQCYGPEASAEAKRLLTGKRVLVRYDPTQGNPTGDGRRVDKYGRDLVYLELPDGRDFMQHMIAHGFAREYRYRSDYQQMTVYRTAQAEAKASRTGLWGEC